MGERSDCNSDSTKPARDIQRVSLLALEQGVPKHLEDDVVVEEPLEIRVNDVSLGITMRTPSDDFDLATGLLWTEGWIQSAAEIGTIAYCPDEDDPQLRNIVNVTLTDSTRRIESSRNTWANSSCGICGKSGIDAIRLLPGLKPAGDCFIVDHRVLMELPDRMRSRQANFRRTGGIHAAGLFDASGELRLIREDLGRHNAVDKVLGAALRARMQTEAAILMVSGRLGFEIAQKAVMAAVPMIVSVSAPSSLAIALADELGITAIGFVRGSSMNIYTHPQRVLHGISKHSA